MFATGPGNMILPFVVDMYKATCKVRCQTHLVIPYQGVHIWIRLAWNACEAAAAFAAEPTWPYRKYIKPYSRIGGRMPAEAAGIIL